MQEAEGLGSWSSAALTSRSRYGILPATFWYLMLMLFSPRYPYFGLMFRGEHACLVLRIARENPWMGCGKIAGEIRKLGFARFGRSSVVRILETHGLTPARRPGLGVAAVPRALRAVHLGQ